MFTDGIQRKSTDFEKDDCNTKTSKAGQLKICFDNKIANIHHGLKEDIAKSLTRWLQATQKNGSNKLDEKSSGICCKGNRNKKSKPSNHVIIRNNSFGFATKLEIGDKHRQLTLTDHLKRVKSLQVNTKPSSPGWVVPSIKSINRTISSKKSDKTSSPPLSGSERFKRSSKSDKDKTNGNAILEAKQQLKRDIATRVNKYDSWRNGINKGSLSLFIISSIFLGFFIQSTTLICAAPLPPSVIAPIWLRDGLINLELNPFESEQDISPEFVSPKLNNDQNQLEHILQRIEDMAEKQQQLPLVSVPEVIPSTLINGLEESAPMRRLQEQRRQQDDYLVKEGLASDGILNNNNDNNNEGPPPLVEPKKEELFWIERRRLDRDRSLEPPPWLREQPMRRGFSTIESNSELGVQDKSSREIGGKSSPLFERVQEVKWPQVGSLAIERQTLGRKSRQPSDEIYQEIFRHLLEEAHGSHSLLDDLYDELELRLKANQRPSSITLSQQANIVGPSKSIDKQKSQRLIKQQGDQNKVRNNGQLNGLELPNIQTETPDSDSTLVVVGDEVSSGDDATQFEEPHLQSSNIFTDSESNNNYDNKGDRLVTATSTSTLSSTSNQLPVNMIRESEELVNPSTGSPKLTRPSVSINADVYFAGPERTSNGAFLLNVDPASNSDAQLLQQTNPISNSFHVIEEIDQADNFQNPTAQPTQDEDDDGQIQQQQQQQQILEQTELISTPSEGKRALFGRNVYTLSDDNLPERAQSESGTAISPYNIQLSDNQSEDETPNSNNKVDEVDLEIIRQGLLDQQTNNTRNGYQVVMKIIESGLLTKDQLVWAATKLKYHLENTLGLTRGTILGLYPMNSEQILIKLDTSKLNPYQVVNMIQNYDYARGFIVTNWPKDSPHSPLPLLSSILHKLAPKYDQSNDGFEEEKEPALPIQQQQKQKQRQQQQQSQSQLKPTQTVEPLSSFQLETDEFDPSADSGGQWNAYYLGRQSSSNSNWNNNWKQPDYSEAIQSATSADDNVARLSHYITQNQQQQLASAAAAAAASSFPKPILVNQGAPSGRLSLDYLAAYLNAIYSNNKAAQQLQNNGQLLSSTNSGAGGPPWSSQAFRNLLAVAARLGGGGARPLVEDLAAAAAASTAYGDEQNKIRHSVLQQKIATSGQSLFENFNHQAPNSNGLFNSYILLHLFALLAAILAAFFAVKIFIHTSEKQQFIRRRFTGSSLTGSDNRTPKHAAWFWKNYFNSSPVTGEIIGEAGCIEAGLKSASFLHRRLSSSETGDETIKNSKVNCKEQGLDLEEQGGKQQEQLSGIAAKNLELLTQKLVTLLNLKSSNKNAEGKLDEEKTKNNLASYTQELDEASVGSTDMLVVQKEDGNSTRFRTSRSYIKSLIEALTKAKAQVSSSGGRGQAFDEEACDDDDDDDDEQQAAVGLLSKMIPKDGSITSSTDSAVDLEQQQEAGILTSQMDISAAHLILAYMEKHLEDKERLHREWRELNDNSASFDCKKSSSSTSLNNQKLQDASKLSNNAKIGQLMMQKLAKCALSDENRGKNRNCSIVPYDRNRVKLNIPTESVIGNTTKISTDPQAAAPLTAQRAKQSDYINASYIYDDDPRRPTHIIAQGPTEQTLGTFWQMVWEQRVSVIVMLTRLNENSVKMCHCYWPTNNASVNVGIAASNSAAEIVTSPKLSSSSSNLNNTDNEPSDKKRRQMQQQQSASSNSPLLETEAASFMSATNNTTSSGGANITTTTSNNGARRSSVTSVFNSCEVRALNSGNNLPIIADGDLSNNILCFEIISSPSSINPSSLERDEIIADSDNGICKGSGAGNGDGNGTGNTSTANKNFRSKATSTSNTSANTLTHEQVVNKKTTRFEVHLVSEHVSSSDYLVRNMYMINRSTGETRTITQFHYLAWSECGVPNNVKSFLQFRRKVHKSYRNLKSPILVHCSDGAGRSGTYTLIDIILERIKNGAKEIDPRATLEHLRDQRVGLCATQKQFEFVLVALAEEIQIILNALPH